MEPDQEFFGYELECPAQHRTASERAIRVRSGIRAGLGLGFGFEWRFCMGYFRMETDTLPQHGGSPKPGP